MANIFVSVSAVLMILYPLLFYAIFLARFTAGFGHGLAYVTVVHHFGEICDQRVRGRVGTSLHLFLLKGGFISGPAIMEFLSLQNRMDPNRFLGMFSFGFSFVAILMTIVFYKESPVTLIESGRESDAIKTMILLRGETEETSEITKSFKELKAMVVQDKLSKSSIFEGGNLRPLTIVLLLRVAFVLSFNHALKNFHIYITHNSKNFIDYSFVLNLVHTLTTVAVMFTIDAGKRKHFFLSSSATSVILGVFGSFRTTEYANSDLLVFIMFVLFELFSAIGLGLTAHIYSTEAFPTVKKSASIAITSIFEFVLQIVFIVWLENPIFIYSFDVTLLLTCGFLMSIVSSSLFFFLPETDKISIVQARTKFSKLNISG